MLTNIYTFENAGIFIKSITYYNPLEHYPKDTAKLAKSQKYFN